MGPAEYTDMLKYLDYKYVDKLALEQNLTRHMVCFDISSLSRIRPSMYQGGIILDILKMKEFKPIEIIIFDQIFITRLVEVSLSRIKFDKLVMYPTDIIQEVSDYLNDRYKVLIHFDIEDLQLINVLNNYISLFKLYIDKLLLGYIDYNLNTDDNPVEINLAGLFSIKDIDFNMDGVNARGLLIIVLYYKPLSYEGENYYGS